MASSLSADAQPVVVPGEFLLPVWPRSSLSAGAQLLVVPGDLLLPVWPVLCLQLLNFS